MLNRLQHFRRTKGNMNIVLGVILLLALASFEAWNYISTNYALVDILGALTFAGLKWATILSFAFCAIDFAGIAKIFTPQQGADEPAYVRNLFVAWVIAALFDGILTWWTTSLAMMQNPVPSRLMAAIPWAGGLFPPVIAIIDIVIRVTLINTFSQFGDRMFARASSSHPQPRPSNVTSAPASIPRSNKHVPAATPTPFRSNSVRPSGPYSDAYRTIEQTDRPTR